jgi:hypothetical protein
MKRLSVFSPLPRAECPVLIDSPDIVEDQGRSFFEGGRRQDVPYLPTRNGYIHSLDERTGLPDVIGDEPSPEHWGAYYWVKPEGLRIVFTGVGVVDPMEAWKGMAVWWGPDEMANKPDVSGRSRLRSSHSC